MNINSFLKKYNKSKAIILLEGKRNVLPGDRQKLVALGQLLASKACHVLFRSGNAEGADAYFTKGVTDIAPERMQVVTPYDNHRKQHNLASTTFSLSAMKLTQEDEVMYQVKQNWNGDALVKRYVAGEKDRNSVKAAYIIRDTIKVIGSNEIPPATFAIFYDDLLQPGQGGTGYTMKICRKNKVPFIDQQTWLKWL